MPSRYWVPFLDISGPVDPTFVHAAVSRWFDHDHSEVTKPYAISPVWDREGNSGIVVSTLTHEAEQRLLSAHRQPAIRLGRTTTAVGAPALLATATWQELEAPGRNVWRVTFRAPTSFKTGNHTSPFPTPSVVLRSPSECWKTFGERGERELHPTSAAAVRVTALNLRSRIEKLRVSSRQPGGQGQRDVVAVLGTITYQADGDTADQIRPLFRLARFSGVGGFRGKGFGVVDVQEL